MSVNESPSAIAINCRTAAGCDESIPPPPPRWGAAARLTMSRSRGRQRERQGLAVAAGAQRVVGADRLLERDGDRLVGGRGGPCLQQGRAGGAADGREGAAAVGLQRLRQRERAVDELAR